MAVVCALAALSFATIGSAGTAKRGGGCASASQPATQVSTTELRKAIQCLINAERDKKGRKALSADRRLAKVAKKHIDVMVQQNCLDHVCGNESSLESRIRRAGYFSGARKFDFGEDVGCQPSAAKMVKNWMNSPIHRENILTRNFEDIGVAASHDRIPSRCTEDYATFVVIFGYRKG